MADSDDTDPTAWMRHFADQGQTKVFQPRSIFIQEGETGGALFLIREGRGKIYSTNEAGKEIVFNHYGPGDTLGEPSLDGGVRTASVMALERTVCSVVRAEDFKRFFSERPEVAFEVICHLIALVRLSNEHIKSLALEDVYGRVVRLLMKQAEAQPDGTWVVRERLTQQEIANRVGSSREMVGRIFKDLERGEYLRVDKGLIAILRKPPPGW